MQGTFISEGDLFPGAFTIHAAAAFFFGL